MIGTEIDIPTGWLVGEPPEGVALMAVEPVLDAPVRASLVVTVVERPAGDDVDRYLDGVLAALLGELVDAHLVDVWTTDQPLAAPPTLGQRLVVGHRVGDVEVDLVQQHTWIDDTIVVVSVTTPIDTGDEQVELLCRCLESVRPAA